MIKETDRKIKEVSRQIGDITGKWGQFVDNQVAPACETIFAERGIPVSQVSQRAKSRKHGRNVEIDILVINGNDLVAVDVKTTLDVEDVRKFLQTLAEFRDFYPQFRDYRILGAVAGMVVEDNTLDFARNQELFVIVPSGETVHIVNESDFQARAW